jgi:DNA-binding CsgD family transcriptional regulator
MAEAMDAVGRIAAVAAEQESAQIRAEYVLEELFGLIPYAAADFAAVDPVSGEFVQLARRGYSDETISGFRDPRFFNTLDILDLKTSGRPMRMKDVPGDPLDTWVIGEILVPAGYREGLTMCLRTNDGRLTGVINLSTETRDHPSDLARDSIGYLCHALGSVADLTQSTKWVEQIAGEGKTAVGLDGRGNAVTFSGASHPEFFHPGSELLKAAQELVRQKICGSFIWPADQRGMGWFRVNVIPVTGQYHDLAAVLTLDTADVRNMSERELQVLSLAARGLSNREIASTLFISDRTVQTHIEHTLVKLSAPNRAAAAAIAAREGLLIGKTS